MLSFFTFVVYFTVIIIIILFKKDIFIHHWNKDKKIVLETMKSRVRHSQSTEIGLSSMKKKQKKKEI